MLCCTEVRCKPAATGGIIRQNEENANHAASGIIEERGNAGIVLSSRASGSSRGTPRAVPAGVGIDSRQLSSSGVVSRSQVRHLHPLGPVLHTCAWKRVVCQAHVDRSIVVYGKSGDL